MKSLVGPFKSIADMHEVLEVFRKLGTESTIKNFSLDPLVYKYLVAAADLDLESTVLAPNIDPKAFLALHDSGIASEPQTGFKIQPTTPQVVTSKKLLNRKPETRVLKKKGEVK